MSHPVEFFLSVQTETGAQDETQAILGALEQELEGLDAEVSAIAPDTAPPEMLEKGDGLGSILDVKIDLDALRSLGTWIYQRLTPGVKVKFKYQEAEFEFSGRNSQELETARAQYEKFVNSIKDSN